MRGFKLVIKAIAKSTNSLLYMCMCARVCASMSVGAYAWKVPGILWNKSRRARARWRGGGLVWHPTLIHGTRSIRVHRFTVLHRAQMRQLMCPCVSIRNLRTGSGQLSADCLVRIVSITALHNVVGVADISAGTVGGIAVNKDGGAGG